MLDRQGYLIINRSIVSADIEDFEFTPRPECAYISLYYIVALCVRVMLVPVRLPWSNMEADWRVHSLYSMSPTKLQCCASGSRT